MTRTVTDTLVTTAVRLLRLLLQPAQAILSALIEVFVIQVQNDASAKADMLAEIVLNELAHGVSLGLATLAPTMLHMMCWKNAATWVLVKELLENAGATMDFLEVHANTWDAQAMTHHKVHAMETADASVSASLL